MTKKIIFVLFGLMVACDGKKASQGFPGDAGGNTFEVQSIGDASGGQGDRFADGQIPGSDALVAADAARDGVAASDGRQDGSSLAIDGGGIFPPQPALNCGPIGWAVEDHGPPSNRVNYAILGDGYLAADLVPGGVFEQHINKAMAKRFSVPIGEVYSRYRNFVNICAIKLPSTAAICNGSALACCGDDAKRLANCDTAATTAAFAANLPTSFILDWRAVVLNGSSWWNTGATTMLWSGGNPNAAGAALHEGGHGFHKLADEYGGTNGGCTTEYPEVNSTADGTATAGKWDKWLGTTQTGATGLQGAFAGSRYCDVGQFRPSSNSMMNSLFGDDPNTSFNSVSREQMIFTIWRAVEPIDRVAPPAGAVASPTLLAVEVIDPSVIDVDWSVDGVVVAAKSGGVFDPFARGLAPGSHTIAAKAYDNAGDDLVRYRDGTCPAAVTGGFCARTAWPRSQQTVTWTVTIP